MFSTYNGSKKFIEIETGVGKKVRCHLPKPPKDKNEIKNSHLPSNKQMWRRTELPTFFANEVDIFLFDKDYDKNSIVSWDEARRQEIIKQTGHDPAQEHRGKPKRILQNHEIDPQYVCEALEQYRQSEYRKVFGTDDWPGGEYVYINGELIYLTRFHYFYLNYWKLNTGWAEYRRTDRNGFYLWQWVLINPYLYGISELCKRGQGKCLSINELCRLYSGKALTAGEVKVGDLLMGDDGTPRLVLDAYRGRSEMFRVKPNKGRSHEVNKNHILHCVKAKYLGPRGNKTKSYRYINISVEDYLKLSPCQQRLHMMRRSGWGHDWESKTHYVEPYYLGLWLGDAKERGTEMANPDIEVIDYLKGYAKRISHKFSDYGDNLHHNICRPYRVTIKGWYAGVYMEFDSRSDFNKYFGKNPKAPLYSKLGTPCQPLKDGDWTVETQRNELLEQLREIGVIGNKHIPDDYLYVSLEDRLELLAGLLDSDGNLVRSKNGNSKFFGFSQSVKRERFSKQVIELAQSCGFNVNYAIYHSILNGKKFFHYRLGIYGDIDIIPTKIKRKQAENWDKKYNPLYCGFSLESVGQGEYAGFEVDGNHLFLLDDGTVIHNSYRAGAIAYLTAISHERAHIGIQSKTDDDAANFFRSKIAEPYKDLPDYLVPLNRNPSDPQNKLEFYPIPLRGSRSEGARRGAEDSLRTTLDFRAARNGSYDGWTLKCYICDEAGKVESKVGDISKRLDILKEAVFRDGRLVGKMYITTTVEDMDGGGNTFEHVWKDGKKYNNQDIPISRFLNYFIKAEESTFFDPFGNPVINPAVKSQYSYLLKRYGEHALLGGREYHKGRKKELEGDSNAYIGYCQRNPNSDGEAFMVRGKGCQYNAAILQKQQRILSDPANANLVNRVDFEWIEEDKTVRWVPNPENGRFDLSWSFLEAEKEANLIRFETDFNNFVTKFPLNDVNFAIGFDPFKAGVTHSNKGKSNAGLAIFRKENLLYDPGQSNTFVCDYVFRPNDPEESYEDLIKVCVFFGCKVLIESQIDDGIRYMNRRGYEPFVMKRPPDTMTTYTAMAAGAPGLPSSQTVVDLYIKRMKSHIQNYGDRLKQPRIVKDLLMFEPDNRTKYDLAVASHLALLAAENPHAVEEEKDEYDVEDLFPMLD